MASAAEQLAQNFNFGAFAKAKELKARLWFTLIALIVYRLGTYIPVPGINADMLAQVFESHGKGILGVFDTFAGGALSRMSVFALNIMPYISASIIIQLMTAVSPSLDALKKEGDSGRKQINQYTRYLTVVLAAMQAYGLAVGLESMRGDGLGIDWFFRLTVVVTLVGGTVFLMWIGEQITARGVGNGISLIIFAGIVGSLPVAIGQMFELSRTGSLPIYGALLICVVAIVVIAAIVYMERAQRKIIVQHPKRQVGNKLYAADSTHLPLKLNTAGVIPPIFASSLLLLPATILGFSAAGSTAQPEWLTTMTAWLQHGQPLYMGLYAAMIIFFAFFYTAIIFNPQETADNLRKSGGFVPGMRPGKMTAQHLDAVLTRLTAIGAVYLAAVCLLPEFLIAEYNIPFYLGGTSLLIVVSVTMDTVGQIHAHILAQQYEGLIKKAKLKGNLR
ncbi:MAG: preprotein translocase subunit SecY [Alphaproteobacteria bacterium]|jgi:preprotein translocase subunit SecY|nr:preprotein translocase subunit SecY [Thalassospira sp.]MCE2965122.1 preprotein translocase subunit SecY [Alphaproteobacteria bacterium]